MKVLQGGVKEWSRIVTCGECHAVLEICEADLYPVNTAVAYAGETFDPRIRVDCAVCQSCIDMTWEVPTGIRHKLFDSLHKGME